MKIITLLHKEYFLWMLAGCLVAGRFIFFSAMVPRKMELFFQEFYFEILIGVVIAIFPFVFYQIFGKYPLQSIRKKENDPNIMVRGDNNKIFIPNQKDESIDYHEIKSGIGLLTQLMINAEEISNKIYRRSGVYLIFGVLIAFSGILFFSLQGISIANSSQAEIIPLLLTLLPKFGILFFIELIAFFFLKQYRAAMDEFRHYDEIKRNRESQLALYTIAYKDYKEEKFSKVVDRMDFFTKVGLLSDGDTTELLELSKQNKNELNEAVKNAQHLIKGVEKEKSKEKST